MKTIFTLLVALIVLAACQKERLSFGNDHAKERKAPRWKVGDLVQFDPSIEHDFTNINTGARMWDIPQPLHIDSFYYSAQWRDNWYFVTDNAGNKREAAIDELSLAAWTGHLRK